MQWMLTILTDNPAIRAVQIGLLVVAVIAIWLVFFTTRDILLRTKVFTYQLVSILLVALLPIVGFFLYLLIRPATTVRQRETEKMLRKLTKKEHLHEEEFKESEESKVQSPKT